MIFLTRIRFFCLAPTIFFYLKAAETPNIVFLLSDDQSTYSLGCYGNKDVKSPQLDRLADDGMVFDRHYDTTAICMASRASVMTGMYEYKHGTNFGHGDMLRKTWENTYPVILRRNGYRTAFAGKFGFDLREEPHGKRLPMPEKDFDMWGGGPGQTNYSTAKNESMKHYAKDYPHSTRSYGAFGRDFILESVKSDKPFCLSISFKAPHKPATPDPIDNHVYEEKLLTDRQIMDENMGSISPSKVSRIDSTSDFIPGIIQTNTMRSWQPTTNKSMPSMWP